MSNTNTPSDPDEARTAGERHEERYLMWVGAFMATLVLLGAFIVVAASPGWLSLGGSAAALAADQPTSFGPPSPDRTSCTDIGKSDLRSPTEGLWFQTNCLAADGSRPVTWSTTCNRTSLDAAEFALVAPGLYVFSQSPAAPSYLWYASSEACFDLVSSRVVIAVCADQKVTFQWDARSACRGHGGVLAWVNGQ